MKKIIKYLFFGVLIATTCGCNVLAQNAGSLPVSFSLAHLNTQTGCFISGNGWDKYMTLTNIFIGPNYSGSLPFGGMPNTNSYTNLTLDLCNSSNGGNLVTGLVVANNFHPSDGETKCGTNDSQCSLNTNASAIKIDMTNTSDACYRVTIYYKSSTTNGLTNITVNWAYTNR